MNPAHLLFKPYRAGALQLDNRLVMAPMTRAHSPGGVPNDEVAAYYQRRAAAGIGLLISEGVWIGHPAAGDRPNVPRFYGDDALAGWLKVVEGVHAAGGKFFPQLWHLGLARTPASAENGLPPAVGPSGIFYGSTDSSWQTFGNPMSETEIAEVIDAYAQAAAEAYRIGCDGVEIHGAHGYLVDQFFWGISNRRTDRYGGSLADRTRFACEVVREIKRRTHIDFPVCLRFSQWKTGNYDASIVDGPEQLGEFLAPLVDAGVDLFHVSTRRYWQAAWPGNDLTLAGWTRKLSGKTTIAVGSVGLDAVHETWRVERAHGYVAQPASLDRLFALLEGEEFDLIAIGRALLVDPAWASKVKRGAFDELVPYSTAIRDRYY